MKLDFVIAGAQKAGSSALGQAAHFHPEISCSLSERHFFDSHKKLSRFERKLVEGKLNGDRTASYSYLRIAIDRLHKFYPDVKIVVSLRNPVTRAYSQFRMIKKQKRYAGVHFGVRPRHLSFMDAVNKHLDIPIESISRNGPYIYQRGLYAEHLKYIYSKFPKENILILVAERISKNPLDNFNKMFEFIGASKLGSISHSPVANKGKYRPMTDEEKEFISKLYVEPNKELFEMIGEIPEWT